MKKIDPDPIHAQPPCVGILLTNLGTPTAPTAAALRRYLGEFLADPRVVELPRAVWRLILHGVILRVRPKQSAEAYAKIWTEEGSPLLCIAERQAQRLQAVLDSEVPGPVRVQLAMRYGEPSISQGMEALRAAGARRVLVFPLYPQYSATTSGSTIDAVCAVLRRWRWLPELRTIMHYHDDPGYIAALSDSVRAYWQRHGRGDKLIMSFHGIPRHYILAGDPYHCHCQKTARLLAAALEVDDDHWQLTFQSRFGKAPWLQPYTDVTMRELGKRGVGRVDVVCPGFSADCLETLEEIRIRNREYFREAGGGELHYIPALNDGDMHMRTLANITTRNLQGWPEAGPDWSTDQTRRETQLAVERAEALKGNFV